MKRWGVAGFSLVVLLLMTGATRAMAEVAPPPEARCSTPIDAGAGAAGAGAAVSETHWQTDWARGCVQVTGPSTPGSDPTYLTPCDRDTRGAIEVYADHEDAQVERKSSCFNSGPEGLASQSYSDCTTSVEGNSGVTAADTCATDEVWGSENSWDYGIASDSSTSVTVDASGVSIERQTAGSDDTRGTDSSSETVTIGPGGVTYTSTADATFDAEPSFDYHCAKTTSVATSDPTSPQVPSDEPSCTIG